jgi:hypothetical protein
MLIVPWLALSLSLSISFLSLSWRYHCHGDLEFWNLMDLNVVKGQMGDGKISKQQFCGN